MVVFTLQHAEGSFKEQAFLGDAKVLATIPGVENFEQLRQVSSKNDFRFGFSMEFADEAVYGVYNEHPIHVAFVPEVTKFLEIDYEPI
jgi:hypothetical protein